MSLPIQHQAAPQPRDLQPLAGDLTLRRGRVHELCGPSRIMLAARIMARTRGPVVWIRPGWGSDRLNAAGLQPLADPARLILVQADRDEGLLWAKEEALRSGAAPLVVAKMVGFDTEAAPEKAATAPMWREPADDVVDAKFCALAGTLASPTT